MKLAVSFAEPIRPPLRVRRSSSSLTIPASTSRCDDEYAGKNAPTTNPIASTAMNDSAPIQYMMGTSATSAARDRSEASIIRRGPRMVAIRPPHRPSTVMPTNWAASTAPIRAGEPVDTSTNHGNAMAVISVPVVEITSAANRPLSGREADVAVTAAERRPPDTAGRTN